MVAEGASWEHCSCRHLSRGGAPSPTIPPSRRCNYGRFRTAYHCIHRQRRHPPQSEFAARDSGNDFSGWKMRAPGRSSMSPSFDDDEGMESSGVRIYRVCDCRCDGRHSPIPVSPSSGTAGGTSPSRVRPRNGIAMSANRNAVRHHRDGRYGMRVRRHRPGVHRPRGRYGRSYRWRSRLAIDPVFPSMMMTTSSRLGRKHGVGGRNSSSAASSIDPCCLLVKY